MSIKKKTDAMFHFLYILVWPIFNLFRPLKVVGRENIPDGPAVVCPNHTTIGDPFYVIFAFGWKYPLRIMAKVQIMRVPLLGWALSKAGVFGVDRGSADLKAAKSALRYLRDGEKLLLFPEGTRVGDGENVDAKAGAALFATRTNSPLLPVYIAPQKKLFRANTVVIGQPYYPEFEGRRPSSEQMQVIATDLMDRIHHLGEA